MRPSGCALLLPLILACAAIAACSSNDPLPALVADAAATDGVADAAPDPDPGESAAPDPGVPPDPDPGAQPDPDPGAQGTPDPGTPATDAAVGDPCAAGSGCPEGGSGTATCLTDWPGGYCAVVDCAKHGHDCPGDAGNGGSAGSKCVLVSKPTCLLLCESGSDCRDGYACQPEPDAAGHGAINVCVPDGGNE